MNAWGREKTSPTVMIEESFTTVVIEAKEGRQEAVVDMPGAKDVIICMRERLTELMAMVVPQT